MRTESNETEYETWIAGVRRPRRVATWLSVAALSLGGLGLAACGEEEPVAGDQETEIVEDEAAVTEPETVSEGSDEVERVTLPRLLSDPQQFVGQTVSVAGAVRDEEVDGEQNVGAAFTIGDALDEDLLVLPTAELTPQGITEDSVVIVEGTVRDLDDALVDQEQFLFEEEGIKDTFLNEFEDEVALVATRIRDE